MKGWRNPMKLETSHYKVSKQWTKKTQKTTVIRVQTQHSTFFLSSWIYLPWCLIFNFVSVSHILIALYFIVDLFCLHIVQGNNILILHLSCTYFRTEKNSCLVNNAACGFPCVNEVSADLKCLQLHKSNRWLSNFLLHSGEKRTVGWHREAAVSFICPDSWHHHSSLMNSGCFQHVHIVLT